MRTLLIATLIVLMLLAATAAGLILWLDGKRLQRLAEAYVRERTDRTLDIGSAERTIAWRPRIELYEVVLSARKPDEPPLFAASRVAFSVVPWSWLSGRRKLEDVEIVDPVLSVRFDEAGNVLDWQPVFDELRRLERRFHWAFTPFSVTALELRLNQGTRNRGATVSAAGISGSMPRLAELTLAVQDAVIELDAAADRQSFRTARIKSLRLYREDRRLPVQLDVNATVDDEPASLKLESGNFLLGDPDTRRPFELSASAGAATLQADGSIQPGQVPSLDAGVNAKAGGATGWSAAFKLRDSEGAWHVTGIDVVQGDSKLRGDLHLHTGSALPRLTGELNAPYWRLHAGRGGDDSPPDGKQTPDGSTVDWIGRIGDVLRRLDAEVDLRADVLDYGSMRLSDVHLPVRIRDGRLTVRTASADLLDGNVEAGIVMNSSAPGPPTIEVSANVDRLSTQSIFDELGISRDVVAGVEGSLQAESRGASVADLLDGVEGRVLVIADGGRVSKAITELADADFAEALADASGGDEATALRCFIAAFDVESGVMKTNYLVIDTADVKLLGHGRINLGERRVDLSLVPHSKDFNLLSGQAPIRIEGPLSDPGISMAKADVAASLLTPIEIGSASDVQCRRSISEARNAMAAARDLH